MKSSSSLQLTLMMGAAATLTACSEPPQNFASVAECVQYGKPEALCRSAYEEALTNHIKSAPRFSSEEECRTKVDVDQCFSVQTTESDGTVRNVAMPLMTGYMIGKNLRDRRDENGGSGGGYFYNGGRYYGAPLYRSRRDTSGYWTSAELRSSTSSSRAPNVRGLTVARGGFGGRAFFGGG